MMSSRGGESGIVMDSSPALTPLVPVSQTSESLSTFLSPEMLMAFQDDLEVSIQGIASARAVRHDSSCPRIAAASASRQTHRPTGLVRECRLTGACELKRVFEGLGKSWDRVDDILKDMRCLIQVRL